MKAVSGTLMRSIEASVIQLGQADSWSLMKRAGKALADAAKDLSFETHGSFFAVLAGKGNNAGDGFVAAKELYEFGFPVRIFHTSPASEFKGDALRAWNELPPEIERRTELHAADLADAIVIDALLVKIEGRARGAEYVSTVVGCYKEAVEAWQRGEFAKAGIEDKIADWNERLSRVFNRGFWDGYYLGQRLGEWNHVYGSQATRKKVYAAKCTNFFKNLSVAEFTVEAVEAIREGQDLLVTGETTGVYECKASGMRDADGKPTQKVKQGEVFSLKTSKLLHRGDKLFLWEEVNG